MSPGWIVGLLLVSAVLRDDAAQGETPAEPPPAIEIQQQAIESSPSALDAGRAFLAANAGREGVQQTPSGLQYAILAQGCGAKPAATDRVLVHYRGSFIDGREFESSQQRGQPVVFTVNRVIDGWQEALQLMPVGSKWKLYVPSHLAYGAEGIEGGPIPPDSTLVFEVELLSILGVIKPSKAVAQNQEEQPCP